MATTTKRNNQIPSPNRSVALVIGTELVNIAAIDVRSEAVGVKAFGLLQLPAAWVPDFFVVSGAEGPDQAAISQAGSTLNIADDALVMVRSSGSLEGIDERGTLDTQYCPLSAVAATVSKMSIQPSFIKERGRQAINFVVQRRLQARAKGHLSNERRLSRHPRDWHVESEGDGRGLAPVAVRKWRDSSSGVTSALGCDSKALIPNSLRAVAAWCATHRAHIEWVWDGAVVWIVQLDYLSPRQGVSPKALVVAAATPSVKDEQLRVFSRFNADQLKDYKKINNARLYSNLGYTMPHFFVMNDQATIRSIIDDGVVPDAVRQDLSLLCSAPFVLRTDATGLAADERQMLPRSDELRSEEAACEWLVGKFRSEFARLKHASAIALIGHHFIPAAASAWCLAMPEERRVRIESLWGIPEGLYFFAHDVYDVDTMDLDVSKGSEKACVVRSIRERYKDKFVAPDSGGRWIVHKTAEGPDWSGSIRLESWKKEIAWTSRRIAVAAGCPVVVMWFVDIAKSAGGQSVIPWYHEPWDRSEGGYRKAAPQKKFRSSSVREIRSLADWKNLVAEVVNGGKVERITINPDDGDILRARDLVDEIAAHAVKNDCVIELSGGLLSHFFYILAKKGCSVECADLFATDREEIEYNKIVRDNIPVGIRGRGEKVEVISLSGDALIEAIKRKIIEEAFEVADAGTADDIADELADVSEVVHALARALGLTDRDISERQRRKRDKRGGFEKSLMLLRTSLSAAVNPELGEDHEPSQVRVISRMEDLPRGDEDFHIDHRVDATGSAERQLTITLPALSTTYLTGEHRFDLSTPSGERHEMFFNAKVERSGPNLRLRLRLTNAALQLSLPFDD